jgi:hypothetical protein
VGGVAAGPQLYGGYGPGGRACFDSPVAGSSYSTATTSRPCRKGALILAGRSSLHRARVLGSSVHACSSSAQALSPHIDNLDAVDARAETARAAKISGEPEQQDDEEDQP